MEDLLLKGWLWILPAAPPVFKAALGQTSITPPLLRDKASGNSPLALPIDEA